jgi:hypothetical protein
MEDQLPTTPELAEDHELALVAILKTNVEIASRAFFAIYPHLAGDESTERTHTEQEAYAGALSNQLEALATALQNYTDSIRHLRSWNRTQEAPPRETPF